MKLDCDGVIALVPGCTTAGGIQASGRIAWEAIRTSPPAVGRSLLFCYGDSGPKDGTERECAIHTASRHRAILAALMIRRRFRLTVVWHMDLLRLLPFLRLRGTKVVLILQGIEAWRRRPWPERALLKRVDQFLSISDYTWRRFVMANPEYAATPHRTVLLGTDAPWEGRSPEPGSAPAALMLGRLARGEDYKGHRQMLDAWPLVRQQIPSAELWIAGDGDLRQDLERLALQRGLGESVRFFGFVSESQKQTLLRQSRCMAVPSRGEGFGLVYLEAMRLGRPCLVSSFDAGQEVVGPPQSGLAVNPDDRDSLADATCRLLSHGLEWDEWSRQARQRYERLFTAKQYQQRLLSALAGVDSGAA
jgi:phosphatidyl-myo-inositol dimannoside synthase